MHWTVRAHGLWLGGPDPALSPVTDLHSWGYLRLAPPALQLHSAGSTQITGFHYCTRTHDETLQPQECTPTPRGLLGCWCACRGPVSCYWPRPSPPCDCLQPSPASTQAPTARCLVCAHHWLGPPPPAVVSSHWTWRHCWRPYQPLPSLWTLHGTHQKPCSCPYCGLQWPKLTRHHVPLGTEPPHAPVVGTLHQ